MSFEESWLRYKKEFVKVNLSEEALLEVRKAYFKGGFGMSFRYTRALGNEDQHEYAALIKNLDEDFLEYFSTESKG